MGWLEFVLFFAAFPTCAPTAAPASGAAWTFRRRTDPFRPVTCGICVVDRCGGPRVAFVLVVPGTMPGPRATDGHRGNLPFPCAVHLTPRSVLLRGRA